MRTRTCERRLVVLARHHTPRIRFQAVSAPLSAAIVYALQGDHDAGALRETARQFRERYRDTA